LENGYDGYRQFTAHGRQVEVQRIGRGEQRQLS
jgi:hypothetical protein